MTLRIANEAMTTIESVRAQSDCGCITPENPPDAELQELIDEASDAFAYITGMKIRGRATYVARPTRCGADCGCPCCGLDGIPLPDGDVTIVSVKIDGEALETSEWDLHPTLTGNSLVRVGDRARHYYWPTSQDLFRLSTQDRTFEIVFEAGVHVDTPLIERAANEIVCYLLNDGTRKRTALPVGATTASMGGVSVGVDYDRFQRIREEMREGRLGPAGSQLVGIYAPDLRRRPAVWAPEMLGGWDLHLRPAS